MYGFSWFDKKQATINPINKVDNKCFRYAVTVALNYEEIKKDPQRITKIKPSIDKYNWKEINFPSEKDDWKKFEENNRTIALNVLYAQKEKIYPAYVSKYKSWKQVILLMILNGEGWHYLAVKELSALLRGIMSKYHNYFYCVNYLHSFATENKRESL